MPHDSSKSLVYSTHLHMHTHTHMHTCMHTHTCIHINVTFSFLSINSTDQENPPPDACDMGETQAGVQKLGHVGIQRFMVIFLRVRVVSCISCLDLLTLIHLYVEAVSSVILWFYMVYCHDVFWFSDAAMASLVMAQTLVMVSVFCRSRHSLVMPWKILQIGEPGRTVEQFFHDVAWEKIQSMCSTTIKLISTHLGRSKESLDEIELSIRLDLAVASYGGYLRYVISQPERSE